MRGLRWVGVGVGLGVAVLALRERLPSVGAVSESLRVADVRWLGVAVVAEAVSMAMFARQQRRLLGAFGVRVARHRALALAYSRSAIAIVVPAGSAVSAAYAFRQFRVDGASRRAAATVMVLSGLVSLVALVLLYVTGALGAVAVRMVAAWQEHPAVVEAAGAMVVAGVVLAVFLVWPPLAARDRRLGGPGLLGRAPRMLRPVVEAIGEARSVGARHWVLALGAAMANWSTDLLCLAAAARAFRLPVDLVAIGAVYLTVQVVRQVPLTPGGIGVIEVSLLAGLVSAGAGEAAAAATVLAYRLLSCWLIIPAGFIGWLVLRRRPVRSDTTRPAEQAPRPPDTPPAPRRTPLRPRSMAARV
ncbi:MAG TPA: lysylphosphatidylglycerol synthase transmembrane domain-containing protein [Actinophytocola sp.]|uniref:lysylphosphatidylglycerol synthase transmembrane domain-containing protein n=1 Tax=Actinophytocola sp. TaxID=1872138 RepID=UPI002DDCFCB7|nr:lysylphosphatidylglycerol synthase transmembrane domain-containing protein [Actinophytocola sp.]HEV2780285.1 lysylphosphatidylglycerol synthase transmembrane domain-containing protein [Actinophytocola sp.]